jgi:peptidoglycan-associated lipoprotein
MLPIQLGLHCFVDRPGNMLGRHVAVLCFGGRGHCETDGGSGRSLIPLLFMKVRGNQMRSSTCAALGLALVLAACSNTPPPGAGGPGGPGAPGSFGAPGAGVSVSAIPGSQQDLEASAGDRVFFAFDRSDITPEAQETLSRQAEWLRRYPNVTVTIEGHCDERGTREYNLALGERRAQAAKNVLVALGIPASRISTISYGKERPAVVGSTEEAYAQNRRAVTVVN